MKQCTKCGRLLDESMFSKRAATKDGLRSQCKDCDKQYHLDKEKKIFKIGKEKYQEQQKQKEQEYIRARTRICKRCGKEFQAKKLVNGNYDHRLYCSDECAFISTNKIKRVEKIEDNLVPIKICAYCGKEFIPVYESGKNKGKYYYNKKYCSKECENLQLEKDKQNYQQNKKRICECCGKEFIVPRIKNGHFSETKYCSDECRYKGTSKSQIQANDDRIKTCLEKYGVPFYCLSKNCREAADSVVISNINKQIATILKELYDIDCEYEYLIEDKAYDLKLKDSNILIEINPTYTHTVIGNHYNNWQYNSYYIDSQLNKTKLAEKYGYRCIHIWDWDVDLYSILNIINSHKIKFYARQLELKEITKKQANIFLVDNHIQRSCSGNSVNLGLYQDEQLIQVMTFGKPRYNKNYEWELLRLCTHKDYIVVGGAEKLFKYFVNNYHPQSIISYCDVSKFTGDVYERLGFKLKEQTKPAKIWSKNDKRITDNLLRMRGFDQLFNTNYGKGTNNEELMLQHGWKPVYDCGQKVYIYID